MSESNMIMSFRPIKFLFFALLSGYVAWSSLGAMPACAHFDLSGLCDEMAQISEGQKLQALEKDCYRMAEVKSTLCGYTFHLGVVAMVLGLLGFLVGLKAAIEAYVDDKADIEDV